MCLNLRVDSWCPYNKSKVRYKVVAKAGGMLYPIFHKKFDNLEIPYGEINECENRGEMPKQHNVGFHVFTSIEDSVRFMKNFSELKFVRFKDEDLAVIEVVVDDFNASGMFHWQNEEYKTETWRKMIITKEIA